MCVGMENSKENRLYRYTNVTSLIDVLLHKHITLLNPEDWDDKNDTAYMERYRKLKGLKTLLALCLTESDETYHHWSIFAGRSDGVRIEFNKDKLLKHFLYSDFDEASQRTQHGRVNYHPISKKTSHDVPISKLPFMKRLPYKDEREFRLLFEDQKNNLNFWNVPISINCIERITLSPWIPRSLARSLKTTLKNIQGCSRLKIYHSTLVYNKNWIKFN